MNIIRARAPFAALLGVVALGLAACTADFAPTAPKAPELAAPAQPSNLLGLLGGDRDSDSDSDGGLLGGLLSNLSLFSCDTPDFGSVSKSIGPAGGVIAVGPHSLAVPRGALSNTVTITATARAGKHVRVDFEPHGLRFTYRATLKLSYAHCDRRPFLPSVVYVAGADDTLQILELVPSLLELSSDRVTARIRHFSGYAIAD
jgi:hypothetical protein